MRFHILFSMAFLWPVLGWMQSTSELPLSEYLNLVKSHHPVAYQADLKQKEGEAYVTKAKGGFDPKLQGNLNQKYFDGNQYYSYLNAGLKIPTWFGIEAQAGYQNNDGYYLNPESYNAETGIWNAGLSVNLGQGLFIDQRRADLKQAKLIKESTTLEKRLILNQLILDATIAYLDWSKAYDKVLLYQQNIDNIKIRYQSVLESVKYGDKPAYDTLKVGIQLQNRTLKLQQAQVELQNKTVMLNTYLWQDGFIPLELDSAVTPKIDAFIFQSDSVIDVENYVNTHPDILMAENNISISKIDYRLKKESLKPTVQVKYNALSSDLGNGVINDYDYNNYKWGLSVAYPIFTRKERANVQLAQIKVEQNQAKLVNKQAQVGYKIESTYNQMLGYKTQTDLQAETVKMYRALLISEQKLFDIGESSLFLVNTRDQNLIEAELKYLEVFYSYKLSEALMNYNLMLL